MAYDYIDAKLKYIVVKKSLAKGQRTGHKFGKAVNARV